MERLIREHFRVVLVIVVAAVILNELVLFGVTFSIWDPLYISSAMTFTICLRLALELRDRMRETLLRLSRGAVLSVSSKDVDRLTMEFEHRAETWAKIGSLVAALFTLAAFVVAYGPRIRTQIVFTTVAVAGGYLAGRAVGRAIAFGTLGTFLEHEDVEPVSRPGHLDGAAGLKPVGDFYFYQAMLLALPALFLAVWWVVIPFLGRYQYWRGPYLALLAAVIVAEVLAFIVPMYSFHRTMKRQKARHLADADKLGRDVGDLQIKLLSTVRADREAVQEQLKACTDRYTAIVDMPTWPVDRRTRRKFTVNNVVLALPLVGRLLNLTDPMKEIVENIESVFSG